MRRIVPLNLLHSSDEEVVESVAVHVARGRQESADPTLVFAYQRNPLRRGMDVA